MAMTHLGPGYLTRELMVRSTARPGLLSFWLQTSSFIQYYNFTLTEGRLVRLKNGFFILFLIKISLLFYFPDKSTLHTINMLIHYTCIQVSSFQKTQFKIFSTLCNNKQKRHYTQYNTFLFFWSSSSKEQHPQNFPICPCTLTGLSSDLGTSLPRAKHNIGFSWLQMLKLFIFFLPMNVASDLGLFNSTCQKKAAWPGDRYLSAENAVLTNQNNN